MISANEALKNMKDFYNNSEVYRKVLEDISNSIRERSENGYDTFTIDVLEIDKENPGKFEISKLQNTLCNTLKSFEYVVETVDYRILVSWKYLEKN